MKRVVVFLLLALSLAFAAPPVWAKRTLLRNVTVIDGTGADPSPGMSILIDGERISKLLPYGSSPPRADKIIDMKGQFLIPGLVDAHYHLIPGVRSQKEDAEYRKFALLGGITAVRDMAGDGAALKDLAAAAQRPTEPSPRIFYSALFAGPTWFANDKRASILMHGLPAGAAPWARAITKETDIAAAVHDAKAAGATAIKIYADLSPSQVKAITAEAHRQGILVWSHATIFPSRPSDAVNAGVNTISHANLMVWETIAAIPAVSDKATNAMVGWETQSVEDPRITALLQSMVARHAILDDTMVHTKLRLVPALAKDTPERAAAVYRWVTALIRKAREMKVTIAAGTDFQESPETSTHPNIHDEIELLVTDAGFTPLEAIRAATLNGAKALGQERDLGTIKVGKRADLVALTGDPRSDIRRTRDIAWVMKGGTMFFAQPKASDRERRKANTGQ